MGLFNLGDIKKQFEKAASSVTDAVQNVPDTIKDIKVEDAVKQVSKVGEIFKINSETSKNARKVLSEDKPNTVMITPKAANMIFYYLMAADGKILPVEEEKLEEIGKEIDPKFDEYWESIKAECGSRLEGNTDAESYHDSLWDGLNQVISDGIGKKDSEINAKLLIWDLYVIAYSDEEMSDEESHLIRYVGRKMGIDPAVPMEMEQSLRTLKAVEREMEWLKDEPRPYSEVKMHMDELEKRSKIIMQGIFALLED